MRSGARARRESWRFLIFVDQVRAGSVFDGTEKILMKSLALAVLCFVVPAYAVDITTCGQVVDEHETGVLQADSSTALPVSVSGRERRSC
jgi:hypothetical protein